MDSRRRPSAISSAWPRSASATKTSASTTSPARTSLRRRDGGVGTGGDRSPAAAGPGTESTTGPATVPSLRRCG